MSYNIYLFIKEFHDLISKELSTFSWKSPSTRLLNTTRLLSYVPDGVFRKSGIDCDTSSECYTEGLIGLVTPPKERGFVETI